MGELAFSPTTAAAAAAATTATVLPVVFVDGDRSVDLGTVTVQPSLGFKKLQAMIADRVGVAPPQIAASLARARKARRVPLDESSDLAAAAARVCAGGGGCYVLACLRRSRRERRGGRSRRSGGAEKKAVAASPEKTILKRGHQVVGFPSPPDPVAGISPNPAAAFGIWDYEAQLRELQRQREWYLRTTAEPPYYHYGSPSPAPEEPALWGVTAGAPEIGVHESAECRECEAAAAAGRDPGFHWCVRDAVTVGFRSPVGPIERPAKKSTSPPPPLAAAATS